MGFVPMTANGNLQSVGRRSGSQKRQRQHALKIALNDHELVLIEEKALACGLSRSSYGRASLLGTPGPRAQRTPPINAEALGRATAALNKIGSNLNQIAHVLNASGAIGMARDYERTLAVVREAATAIREIVGRKDRA
jgi:hypothetical protein